MKPAESLPAIAPTQRAGAAIELMNKHQLDHVPVTDGDKLLGVLGKDDLIKWMSLRETDVRGPSFTGIPTPPSQR